MAMLLRIMFIMVTIIAKVMIMKSMMIKMIWMLIMIKAFIRY